MIINVSPYFCNYNNEIEFQFKIKWWKYDKLIFLKDEIKKKKCIGTELDKFIFLRDKNGQIHISYGWNWEKIIS